MGETERFSDIVGFARRLRIATAVVMAGLATATVAAFAAETLPGPVRAQVVVDGLGRAAWPIAGVLVALVLLALNDLRRMLRCVEGGDLFGAEPVQRFRRFAMSLFAASTIGVIAPWVAGLGRLAQGDRTATLSLEANDGLIILLSVVMLLIARLFQMAAAYQDDSRSFL